MAYPIMHNAFTGHATTAGSRTSAFGEQVLVLYDLASNDHVGSRPWSPSTWKIHVLLRQLNLTYKTIYLDFPDLEPTFASLNIPPNTNPHAHGSYTVPVLYVPPPQRPNQKPSSWPLTGIYIMDSDAIIRALRGQGYLHLSTTASTSRADPSLKPNPPILHHSPPLATVLQQHVSSLGAVLTPFILPAIVSLLPPRGAAWYRASRGAKMSGTFEELRASTTLKFCFINARDSILGLEDVIRRSLESNPGHKDSLMTWEEITVVALLAFFGRVDRQLWEGVMAVAREWAEKQGRKAVLAELWAEAEQRGLIGEVFA